MKDCSNNIEETNHLTNAEMSLIKTIRNINDPDKLAQISDELSNHDLKISFLLIAADLMVGATD